MLDTEGTGILKKTLYCADSGIVLQSEAAGSLNKAIEIESGVVLDTEATGILEKLARPESSGVVIDAEDVNADLKRYRLLSELDDLALEDIDDMTLDELDWIWLT